MGGPDPASSQYWELTVPSSTESSEALTNFLWDQGAVGVVEEALDGAPPRLRAFFPVTVEPGTLAARVRDYTRSLAILGLGEAVEPRVEPLVDENWAEAWRAHFTPVTVGHRLIVAPPWNTSAATGLGAAADGRVAAADGRVLITIEPGRAFGTGHHGSTAGCLEALEASVEPHTPPRVIDVGTGSGILAIAAARLGVRLVLAIDEDPDAVAAAVANAALNGVADRVRVALVDVAELETDPAPLVVANLLSPAHMNLGRRYGELVLPGGVLILGGILAAEASAVSERVCGAGFAPRETRSIEDWATLVLTRVRARASARAKKGVSEAPGAPHLDQSAGVARAIDE